MSARYPAVDPYDHGLLGVGGGQRRPDAELTIIGGAGHGGGTSAAELIVAAGDRFAGAWRGASWGRSEPLLAVIT